MIDQSQLKFSKTHEWFSSDADLATVGITQHAQEEISDVVFVELPKVGKALTQGAEAAVVESVKAAFSIYAPISGTIARVNEALTKDPGAVNRSPHEEGWIFVLEPANVKEAESLMTHEQYQGWVVGEKKHS